MDRSAVIPSMDRGHSHEGSDPYPLELLMKADQKRLTVVLYQCDFFCLLGILQLQVQAHAQTYTHTHTTQLGWILPQDGFTIALWQTWQTHIWGMDRVWIGYGTEYGTKSGTFPDEQKVC